MYRPNFCAECGEQIVRLKWRLWTSRRFCRLCAARFRSQQIKSFIAASLVLLVTGFVVCRAGRPSAPPLVIERRMSSPANEQRSAAKSTEAPAIPDSPGISPAAEEALYMCGARTKKGTPCSRRVHGPVRCWQHKGLKPMLAQEKLRVK